MHYLPALGKINWHKARYQTHDGNYVKVLVTYASGRYDAATGIEYYLCQVTQTKDLPHGWRTGQRIMLSDNRLSDRPDGKARTRTRQRV